MSLPDKKIAIVCNAKAGNGKALQVADQLVNILKAKQVDYSLFTAHWPQLWIDVSAIWIVGGDGTLNYFINDYPGLEIPLSIFKGGTGNDFQELLYAGLTIEEQVERVLNGRIHLVDGGICNGKIFLNGVGIGFDGAIVKELLNKNKRPGQSTYFATVLRKILFYRGVNHVVKFDHREISQKLLMVNIANGKTEGGGFAIAPEASPTDGKLDINIVKELTSLQRLIYLPKIEKGKHLRLPLVEYHQTDKIEISTPGPIPAHIDGEYFEADKFIIECLPKRFSFFR